MSVGVPAEVFGDDVRRQLVREFADLPTRSQPALYAAAVSPEYGALRTWLGDELASMGESGRPQLVGRLQTVDGYSGALSELAAHAVLRDHGGLKVELGPQLGVQSPDLLATDRHTGRTAFVADVWTRTAPGDVLRAEKAWANLSREARKTKVPLRVDILRMSRETAPGAVERKRILSVLGARLRAGVVPGQEISCEGMVFRVVGRTDGALQLISPSVARTVDRDHVVEAIETKVARYGALADELDAPLVVIVAAEPLSGLTLDFVEGTLRGLQLLSMNFDVSTVGPSTFRTLKLRRTAAPPVFDTRLSAVAFLDVRNGYDSVLTAWPMPDAVRPLSLTPTGQRVEVRPAVGVRREDGAVGTGRSTGRVGR